MTATPKEYTDILVTSMEDKLQIKICSLEKSIAVAKIEVDRRLDDMNKLRDQITEERGAYITRDYYEAQHKGLEDVIYAMRDRLNSRDGEHKGVGLAMSTVYSVMVIVAMVSGTAASVIATVFLHR